MEEHYTCSGGLLNAGETEALEETPDPDRISLRMPLIPRRSKVLAPRGDPLAQVERSRIKPCICLLSQGPTTKGFSIRLKRQKIALTVYVDVLREACPPPELLVEMRVAACVTSP